MKNKLYYGDCLDIIPTLEKQSIDLICADLPYGITHNQWDQEIIPIEPMWAAFRHVLKPRGTVVLTAAQPFASLLVTSNLSWFKYDMIWRKTIGSGQLNVNNRPMRIHENILVFCDGPTIYNEQRTLGSPYKIKRNAKYKNSNYSQQRETTKDNDGFRHATSVLDVSNPRIKDGHPTQKPVELMANLIRTFSNENDVVFDCCMGSGTTGVAAIETGRRFIGIEKDACYFAMAKDNISHVISDHYIGSIVDDYLELFSNARIEFD